MTEQVQIPWEEFPELSPSLEQMIPRILLLRKSHKKLVEGLEGVLERVRNFSRKKIWSRALDVEEKVFQDPRYFDWEITREGAKEGWLSFAVPKEVGGQGYLVAGMSLIMEEMCSACAGIGNIFGAHALGFSAIALSLDMKVIDRHLGKIVEEEKKGEPWLFSLDITEPSAGSDVEDAEGLSQAKLTLEAKKVSGGYILNGRKCFISNGSVARTHFVTAALDRKDPLRTFTAFVVPADAKGVSIGRVEKKMGQKACPAAEVIFEDVFVPEQDRMGNEGEGMLHTIAILCASRAPVGAIALGIARGAYERAYYYAHTTKKNGKYLIEDQKVQYLLAEMYRQIQLARQGVYDAAFYFDFEHVPQILKQTSTQLMSKLSPYWLRRQPWFHNLFPWGLLYRFFRWRIEKKVPVSVRSRSVQLSSLAKVSGSDTAVAVSRMAMEILGEEAVLKEWGVEKCFRDAKLTQIYEGTNQLNRLAIIKEQLSPGISEGINLEIEK